MSANIMFLNSDNTIQITGLKKVSDGSYINAAIVEVTITDEADAQVPGITWPVTLDYQAASNGNYIGVIGVAAQFIDQTRYVARVSVDGGPGMNREWNITFGVKKDES